MFIFCPRRQKTNQKNAAQEERGLVREKANMPHFLVLRHPLPLRHPSPVGKSRQKGFIDFKKVKSLFQFRTVAVILIKPKALSRKRPFPKGKL